MNGMIGKSDLEGWVFFILGVGGGGGKETIIGLKTYPSYYRNKNFYRI